MDLNNMTIEEKYQALAEKFKVRKDLHSPKPQNPKYI